MTLGGLYTWYHFSSLKTMVNASRQARSYYESAAQKFQESTPNPDEAFKTLRQWAQSYAAFVPGASGYVNTAFDDLETIRSKHSEEFDKIVKEAYEELKDIAKSGVNVQNAQKAADVLQKHMGRMYELGADAFSDILNNHPDLKEKVGGNLDQLKQMGSQYGPEAKKQVDQTWDQIRDIMNSGISAEAVMKVKKLVEEKKEQLKKVGDEAWKKGMEQAKPYLDKNPKIKEIIEKNQDALKQGNAKELFDKARSAVESGSTDDLEKYVSSALDKAKQSGIGQQLGQQMGGLDKYMKMIPNGDEILSKLSQLKEVADKHSKEGEQLLKETFEELQKVISNKADKAKDIAEKAKKESK